MHTYIHAYSVTPSGVSLVYTGPDQISGTGFIEFRDADELARALALNKEPMGHRYVELYRSTRNEAMKMLGMGPPPPHMLMVCIYVCILARALALNKEPMGP